MHMTVMILGLWAVMLLAHDTPSGRFLNRLLVEHPARLLNRITRRHLLLATGLLGLLWFMAWLGGADGFLLMSSAAPEIWLWLSAFEISAYLDAIITLAAVAALVRSKGARDYMKAATALRWRNRGARARRRRARRITHLPANDEENGPRFAIAA